MSGLERQQDYGKGGVVHACLGRLPDRCCLPQVLKENVKINK